MSLRSCRAEEDLGATSAEQVHRSRETDAQGGEAREDEAVPAMIPASSTGDGRGGQFTQREPDPIQEECELEEGKQPDAEDP